MNKLVSVVITTYGRTDSLSRAIESVLQQTYPNYEIVVVDDNRELKLKKEVAEIVSSFNNEKIKLVCNTRNLGGALSRNEGINASKGEYVSFLDDDDEYMSTRLEKQVALFESLDDNVALIYCYCIQRHNHVETRRYRYDYVGNCIYDAMLDCIAATSQWMCRKEALVRVGMFTDTPCKQDSYLLLKLLVNGYSIDRVPEYLSIYNTDSETRISNEPNHKKRIIGEEKFRELCRDNYSYVNSKEIKEVEYAFSCRLVEHYFGIKDYKVGLRLLMNIVITHPVKRSSLRSYKHVVNVLKKQVLCS